MTTSPRPVLILGAGINGAAIARELLLNGVPVCIVDCADIASGATSYSSRLIHGGLRYLEYGEFGLVRESLAERGRLFRLAPQFVKPLRLFIPTRYRFGGVWRACGRLIGWPCKPSPQPEPRGAWLIRAGLWLYDTYARDPQLPRHAAHRMDDPAVPRVDQRLYRWLHSFSDAQIAYPERFVLALLEDARRLAVEHGVDFRMWTYHRAQRTGSTVVLFSEFPNTGGPHQGPSAEPVYCIEPSAIINATGAWVDHTLSRLQVTSPRLIGGTKGSHFLTGHAKLLDCMRGQGVYAAATDGRPIFVLPFGDAALVGTTDLPFDDCPRHAVATPPEIDYLVDAVNRIFPSLDLRRNDVDLYYCGVRPLPVAPADNPATITRRHWLVENTSDTLPVFSVVGGKLTTCRSLAESTAATVLASLEMRPVTNSRNRPIPGGDSYPPDDRQVADAQRRLVEQFPVSPDQVTAMWSLLGTRTSDVLSQIVQAYPSAERPYRSLSHTALPCPFVRWVVRHESVTTLCDLVERRVMLLYDRTLSAGCLRELAEIMADEHVISDSQVEPQVEACVARLERHYGKRVEG